MKIPNSNRFPDLRHPAVVLFLFVCLSLLIYSNILGAPFVHDDVVLIQNNPQIKDLSNLSRIFLQQSRLTPRIEIANAYNRPLLDVTNRILFFFFGPNPLAYHLLNVLLHALNAFLLWRLIRRLKVKDVTAWMTALLFLAHPVQSEAVACISGLSNVLAAFWGLSVLWLFFPAPSLKALSKKREIRDGVLIFVFVLAGLFVKESTIIIPLVMVLMECIFVPAPKRFSSSRRTMIFSSAAAVIIFLAWRHMILGGGGWGAIFANTYELWLRVRAIPDTLLMYGRILLIPGDLHYYRSMDILNSGVGAARGTLLIVLIGLFLWSVLKRKGDDGQKAAALFGAGWFLLTLLPMLNIIPLIHEYSFIAAFEHFLYLPMIGALLVLLVLAEICLAPQGKNRSRKYQTAAFGFLVIVAGLMTYQQNRFWQNEIALFERAARFEPRLGRVRLLLAKAYYQKGQYQEAENQYGQALSIMSGYWSKTKDLPAGAVYAGFMREILFDLAHCHEALDEPDRAVERYRQILQLKPDNPAIVLINVGIVFLRTGRIEQAKETFRQVLEFDPGNSMAKTNLAVCYLAARENQTAEALLREVLARDPGFLPAKQNLELLLREK